MTRIAVLGANGQVGAELCLLLAARRDVELVPVCRRKFGSAFLRSRGVACRHGSPADSAQAAALFGDCDVIVNLALVGTISNPGTSRAVDRALLHNIASLARPGARHLYFSTMSVHGDRRQDQRFALRNSYGQQKLRCERIALLLGQQAKQETCIFRLGHVCGELQGITRQIRRALQSGPLSVPDPDRASNTVYVATIAEAILRSAAGKVEPGIYDLMNVPQWSWREVFEREARLLGIAPRLVRSGTGSAKRTSLISQAARVAADNPAARRAASRLAGHLPASWYRKARALYSIKAAGADIARLRGEPQRLEATLRTPVGSNFVPGLSPTAVLLETPQFQLPAPPAAERAWPADLPLFRSGRQEPPLPGAAGPIASARASSPT